MRPVPQLHFSLKAKKRAPLAASRNADSPPKPRKREVRTSPLRNSNAPKRTWERSRGSKAAIGRALTSIVTGAVTENSSATADLGTGWTAACGRAPEGIASVVTPAAAEMRKWRREKSNSCFFLMVRRRACAVSNHEAPSSCPVASSHCITNAIAAAGCLRIVARDVVPDADRDQFHRRAGLDLLDDVAQVPLEIVAGVDRKRVINDRGAIGDHHQDLALFGAAEQALVG